MIPRALLDTASRPATIALPHHRGRGGFMMRVDADAHVDETEATGEYLGVADERSRPITLDPGVPTVPNDRRPHRLWLIDGQPRLRRWRDDQRTGTVKATRELLDVDARLRHMDELRIDVQVLYPTLFLQGMTGRAEVELALTKSSLPARAPGRASGRPRRRPGTAG